MELFLLFVVLIVGFFVWQYIEYTSYVENKRREMLVKNFFERIVTCKIEKRDGEYFLYNEMTKQFLAQGRTPKEVGNNLPKDGRFYLSMDGHREIQEELEEIECMQLKST
jgi:hypothetical protein